METAESSPQVEEATEPPIGGSHLQDKEKQHDPGLGIAPLPHDRHRVYSVAHALSAEQTALLLKTDVKNGLSKEEAAVRLQEDGPNTIKGAEGLSVGQILLRQVSNSLTLVLAITMAISFGIKDYIEGGVIAAVILFNIIVGFVQDYGAENQIKALQSLSAPVAKVIRGGISINVKAENIVLGDLVQLSVGDIVPADLRLIDSVNLSTNEAMLTGESLTISKKPLLVFPGDDIPLGDRKNMAYSASAVTQGRGTGCIIATGASSEVGKIGELMRKSKDDGENLSRSARIWKSFISRTKTTLGLVGTPLTVSLSRFALLLFALAISLTIIVFAANKFDVNEEVLIYGICVAVAIIPESLIAVLTVTQAVGAKAMARVNVIVRTTPSLEAIGAVTNICSDKTGTLTQGKMVATEAWIPGQGSLHVVDTAHPYDPESGSVKLEMLDAPGSDSKSLSKLVRTMALCNLASVSRTAAKDTSALNTAADDTSEWVANGEPTEVALQVLAMRFGLGKAAVVSSEQLEAIAEYPFESASKRMTVIYRTPDGVYHAFSKGATEVLLDLTTMSNPERATIRHQLDVFASRGLRVLSFGYRTFNPNTDLRFEPTDRATVERGLEFLGLVGIHDPPRPESSEAVRTCQIAGIKVHMLTGDHKKTAEAIAKSVGILPDGPSRPSQSNMVMSASDFDNMTDSELDDMQDLPLVVARCSPSTKVRMVEAMHRRNAFCVMTGDGVNDAPALKRANVGIAMGLNGSDVAKEAADFVLTDDNFASIVKAVEEGRRLFDNVQKFLMHLLISNISQVLLLLLGLAFRDQDGNAVFPLAPLEILWVNLITSSFLAIGLGLEKAQHDIMLRPPHDLKIGVFTRELIIDKMMYGTFMGSLCLAAFASVAYGIGGGQLGTDCNNGWNESCDVVFRARATTYATLTFLLLVTAWEVKHFKRSLFDIDPVRFRGPFSVFPAVWSNRFLFWAVTAGFVLAFPIVYLPVVNREVFKHKAITFEWGIVVACLVVYVGLVEGWKALKRRMGWGVGGRRGGEGSEKGTGGTATPV